jgi:AraC-like DNA-binding protein
VVLKGTMVIETDAGRWLAPMGRACWLPPGLEHGARYSEDSRIVLAQLSPKLSAALPEHGASIAASGLLRELALAIAREAAGDDEAALMARLLAKEIARPQEGGGLFLSYGTDARLRRATALLLAEPGRVVMLGELAVRSGASPRTLARLFEAETGMGFSRWREHLRVNLAVDRLIQGQSITRTALELGYQSPGAFSTMFTRLLGLPPSRFLKMFEE